MSDKNEKKAAHDFVQHHGKAVAENLPGGNEKMGFRREGPQEGKMAAKAQSYEGDVSKGSTFADLQRGAMKKN